MRQPERDGRIVARLGCCDEPALQPRMPNADLQVATLALFGMLNWTCRWWHALPKSMNAAALGRRMARLFLDGFAPG